MYTKEIKVFHLAQTKVDKQGSEKWLKSLGVENTYFLENTECGDGDLLTSLAAKRCYLSFELGLNPNVQRIRNDLAEYLENVIKSKHGSVLEHTSHVYAIEGLTRVATAELNRHRAGWTGTEDDLIDDAQRTGDFTVSEGSLRFIRFNDIPFWCPLSMRIVEADSFEIKAKKEKTQEIFKDTFIRIEQAYQALSDIWDMDEKDKNFHYKKIMTSTFRRIIPMGVCTGGVWGGNLRALWHTMTMRCSEAAEEEIAFIFSQIAADVMLREPLIFKDWQKDEKGYWRPPVIKP